MKKTFTIIIVLLFFALLSYWAVVFMVADNEKSVQVVTQNTNFIEKVKAQIRKLKFEARVDGKLTAKNSNYLVVRVDNKDYTIFLASNTVLRPKYWGSVDLTDFNLGDDLNIIGSFRNKDKNEINATLVRDLSNEKRWAVILGDVISKDNNKILFNNKTRGDISVMIDGNTKYVSKENNAINLSNINPGDRIRVKGIFDNKTMKITDVDELKDFSLQ